MGRFGGIVEAAKRLGISAGAVSQQMKLLEDTLGLSLTLKVGKRIRLTAAGQRYHDSCAAAFESLRIAQVEVERSKNASNLRISALPSLLSDWLAPHIYAWQDEHPELNLFLDGSHAEPSPEGYEGRIEKTEKIVRSGFPGNRSGLNFPSSSRRLCRQT